jgi:hypothetical protein
MIAGSRLGRLFAPASEAARADAGPDHPRAAVRPLLSRRGAPAAETFHAEFAESRAQASRVDDDVPTVHGGESGIPEPRHRLREAAPLVEKITIVRDRSAVPPELPSSGVARRHDEAAPPVPRPPDREPASPPAGERVVTRPSAPPSAQPPQALDRAAPVLRPDLPKPAPPAPAAATTRSPAAGVELAPQPRETDRRDQGERPPIVRPSEARIDRAAPRDVERESRVVQQAQKPPEARSRPPVVDGTMRVDRGVEAHKSAAAEEATTAAVVKPQTAARADESPSAPITGVVRPAAEVPRAGATPAPADSGISIRIGRVEIVATPPRTVAATPPHRPARVIRTARRHQIQPRLPIPKGRW